MDPRAAILADPVKRKILGIAFSDVLQGIQKHWGLTIPELVAVLGVSEGELGDWLRPTDEVRLSGNLDASALAVLNLIEFYECIASFFVETSDQTEWIRGPSARFSGKSPLEMLASDPERTLGIVHHMLNP
jgi:hypothetical protein